MAETGADPDRRKSFDFYQLQRAVENRLSSYEAADRLLKMDPKEQSLRQLVKQFRHQQPVISKDEIADAPQVSQETDPELKELNHRREGRLDLAKPGVHGGALTQQQSSTTDQEMDEMVNQ